MPDNGKSQNFKVISKKNSKRKWAKKRRAMTDKSTNILKSTYMTKDFLSKACSDFIEDMLRKTFDEEDPVTTAPIKCSQQTQTCEKDVVPQIKKKKFLF